MHNGKAIWDGVSDEPYTVTVLWKVDFVSSPIAKRNATFSIAPGDSAVVVARKLSAAWNSKDANQKYPAIPEGATVRFGSTIPDSEIVSMRSKVLNSGVQNRIPAAGAEVEVSSGLWVHRSK